VRREVVASAQALDRSVAGRMNYEQCETLGIPCGSGAIQSSIRRVINPRMKNNGIFCREENAEIMLQRRALVISQIWDDGQPDIRALTRKDDRTGWRWDPRTISCKDETNSTSNIYSLLHSAQPRPQSGNAPRHKSRSWLALLRSAPQEPIAACILAIGAAVFSPDRESTLAYPGRRFRAVRVGGVKSAAASPRGRSRRDP